MRIVIDVQGAQALNRARGIGRASIALIEAMTRHAGSHEIWLAANGALTADIGLERRLGERIRIFDVPGAVREAEPANAWRARAAELAREDFLRSLRADAVLITSLFEGLHDDAVTSIGALDTGTKTAAVLYDLIPLDYPDIYLGEPAARQWYERKLRSLKRADLVLPISAWSGRQAIERLDIAEERIRPMPLAAHPRFRKIPIALDTARSIRDRLGIRLPFVMYTGGIDYRKNIERLIEAFAILSARTGPSHQLVIVCACTAEDRQRLQVVARRQGLGEHALVMTGHIDDDTLVALYNLATLFVFPSLAEGFGLPLLEAMACGAPVISSNRTCLPEIVGRDDALFDPQSAPAIADKLQEVLADEGLRRDLVQHGLDRSRHFSWDRTAQTALDALERMTHRAHRTVAHAGAASRDRPLLALVSPLPPDRSGIANYSAELIPELAAFYDVEIITDHETIDGPSLQCFARRPVAWFDANAGLYDRIVYQFGNSLFHLHMLALLARHSGVVVLHDFFVSDILGHASHTRLLPPDSLQRAFYRSHGYAALITDRRHGTPAATATYPANGEIVDLAQGVIVHSRHALRLAVHWYGEDACVDWAIVPQLRRDEPGVSRDAARKRLGLNSDDFVVCSFGHVTPTKMADRLLSAWLASDLAEREDCVLVFVGTDEASPLPKALPTRVRVTGYVSSDAYADWLAAGDIAVQLRTRSRGETSRAVLDVLAHGLPLIFNAHGSASELPDDVGFRLPDSFDDAQLGRMLEDCLIRADLQAIGAAGRAYIRRTSAPPRIGALYRDAIERFAGASRYASERAVIDAVAVIEASASATSSDLHAMARILARQQPARRCRLHIGLPFDIRKNRDQLAEILRALIDRAPANVLIEPVQVRNNEIWSAHRQTCRLLKLGPPVVGDELMELRAADSLICLENDSQDRRRWAPVVRDLQRRNIIIRHVDLAAPNPVDDLSQVLFQVAENPTTAD